MMADVVGKQDSPGGGLKSRWWRYAWGAGSLFGVGVIVGMMVVNRLSRPSIKLG